MMSYQGLPVEEIARLAGHASSRTTEVIYRRELRPVIATGAEFMDQIFRTPSRSCPQVEDVFVPGQGDPDDRIDGRLTTCLSRTLSMIASMKIAALTLHRAAGSVGHLLDHRSVIQRDHLLGD
jgi:hypothetical protein